jgi:hypothetical protein
VKSSTDSKKVFNGKIRFCSACGCILEFRYTEYIPSKDYSLLGYYCVNRFCVKFGEILELSKSDIIKLLQLGFTLRKFGGIKN